MYLILRAENLWLFFGTDHQTVKTAVNWFKFETFFNVTMESILRISSPSFFLFFLFNGVDFNREPNRRVIKVQLHLKLIFYYVVSVHIRHSPLISSHSVPFWNSCSSCILCPSQSELSASREYHHRNIPNISVILFSNFAIALIDFQSPLIGHGCKMEKYCLMYHFWNDVPLLECRMFKNGPVHTYLDLTGPDSAWKWTSYSVKFCTRFYNGFVTTDVMCECVHVCVCCGSVRS